MVILFSQRPSPSRWCRRSGRKPRLFSDAFYLIMAILLGWVISSAGAVLESASEKRLYVDYSAKPSPEHLAAFDLCILDAEAKVDFEPGHALGHRYLAYLSTVEVRAGSRLGRLAAERGISLIGKNEIWGTGLMDVLHPAWLDTLVGDLAQDAMVKGFDGFFLDTLDSVALLDKAQPEKAGAHRAAIISLIKKLRERHPDAPIVVNRGFDLMPEISRHLSGVLVESVYRTCDPRTKTYTAVQEKDSAWLVEKIRAVQRLGLRVYAVDYVPATDLPLAKETAAKLAALGCTPFVTTIEVQGVALAPLCEVSRRVLVLYGAEGGAAGSSPAGTFTAAHSQAVLEWLGCEVVYQDVRTMTLNGALPHQVAGVILDPSIKLDAARELALVRGLADIRQQGKPILLLGCVPVFSRAALQAFQREFGLVGTMKPVPGIQRPRIAALDGAFMSGGAPVTPRSLDFMDIQAPPSSQILLSVRGQDREGREARFDPAFLSNWGGAWLSPYVISRSFDGADSFHADAFALFSRWLGLSAETPVPDTTTLDGRRVFFSQVNSDGFAEPSHFPGHPTCGEVLRDRIFSVFPLPTTVAVEPAALRPLKKSDAPLNAAHHENIARTLFTIPHLQAAAEGAVGEDPGATLVYLNKRLLTGGKITRLVLWPDAMSIPAGVSAYRREAEVEFLAASSAGHPADTDLTRGFNGLYQGGYENVLRSFDSTSSTRRTTPVGLRYQFRSGAAISSVRALEAVHEWCLKQPLHPVTALDYAQIKREAASVKIFALDASRWMVAGAEHLRTIRLPADGRMPDMRRSESVSGWKQEGACLYVHTLGKRRAVIALADAHQPRAPHLRLQESGADILFHELQSQKAVFEIRGWTDATITFAGMAPGAICRLTRQQEMRESMAGADGTLNLTLAPRSTYTLEIFPTSHAASL